MKNGEYHLRGTAISALIQEADVISATWLAWTGSRPSEKERIILQACFIACLDHGVQPPSAHVTRTVASCGKPLADSVAAGLLTLGPRHGNAAGAASEWIHAAVAAHQTPEDVVSEALESKTRLPGLGHPEYDVDPRVTVLSEIAKTHLSQTVHLDFAQEVSRVMSEQKGKPLPLNIDGALGAIMADMGAPSDLADAVFIASRTIGLIAHAREESGASLSYRRGV